MAGRESRSIGDTDARACRGRELVQRHVAEQGPQITFDAAARLADGLRREVCWPLTGSLPRFTLRSQSQGGSNDVDVLSQTRRLKRRPQGRSRRRPPCSHRPTWLPIR